MNKTASIIFIIIFIITTTSFAVPASVSKKIIQETIKLAAKKSGKTLKPAMRKALEKTLLQASKQYGDDVIKIVSKGGLEVLEQGEAWKVVLGIVRPCAKGSQKPCHACG